MENRYSCIDWESLRNSAHSISVAHGWWEEPKSERHYLCLVVSELMEAVEADRKDSHHIITEEEYVSVKNMSEESFCLWFKDNVKDTFEDELADAVIRILDLAGYKEYFVSPPKCCFSSSETTECVFSIVYDVVCHTEDLNLMLSGILCLSSIHGIDIEKNIRLKMRYNSHRPYKHGKRY